MTEARVRGVMLCYEVIGEMGPWIALTPGSRRSYDELVPLSKLLAQHGYRVLLHDRRNCGRLEVGSKRADQSTRSGPMIFTSYANSSARFLSMSAARRRARAWRCCLPCATLRRRRACCCGASPAASTPRKSSRSSITALSLRWPKPGAWARSAHPTTLPPASGSTVQSRPAHGDERRGIHRGDGNLARKLLAGGDLPVVGATEEQLRGMQFPPASLPAMTAFTLRQRHARWPA